VLLAVLRGVPELVWALLFVRVFGLGPAAGVLALGITYGGMLGKVYGEILESTDARPARSLLEAGSGRLAALAYGLLPNAARELLSYTVYRWECAVRASVVMGFVGAGGLGQLMDQSMKMLNGGEAATILATFLVLVLAADGLAKPCGGGWHEPPGRGFGRRRARRGPAAGGGGGQLRVAGHAPRGLVHRGGGGGGGRLRGAFLPARSVGRFSGQGGLGGPGDAGDLAAQHPAGGPRGAVLALPAAGATGLPAPRGAFRAQPAALGARAGVGDPDGAGRRPRPFAGTLALALHTTGVLGRLFAEALENSPPTPAEALAGGGAPALATFLYGTLPLVAPQWLAYALYRWEMNIRMAAILGFVGAGGWGRCFTTACRCSRRPRRAP
jgi:phosphonate transport system permease protein